MSVLFSIIIRTKNEEAWIKRCLKMIYTQKNQDFEVIIVDNQSTDRTLEIARTFEITKILSIEDFFPGRALNLGIAAAVGKYVVALSAHCIPVSHHWLDELKNSIEFSEDPRVVAGYGRQIPVVSTSLADKRDLLNTFGLDPVIQTKDFFFHNANSIVKREFLSNNPYDDNLTNVEDRVWAKGIIEEGYRIAYTPHAEVYHHHGLNHANSEKRLRQVTSLIEPLYKELKIEHYDVLRLSETKAVCIIISKDPVVELEKCLSDARHSQYIKQILIVSPIKPPYLRENEIWVSREAIKNVDQLQLIEILGNVFNENLMEPLQYDYCVFISPYFTNRPVNFIDNLLERAELQYFDVCFAGKRVYPNLWKMEYNGNYELVDPNTSLRDFRTPLLEGFFGLGLVLNVHMLGKKEISDGYVGIFELDDYSILESNIRERYF